MTIGSPTLQSSTPKPERIRPDQVLFGDTETDRMGDFGSPTAEPATPVFSTDGFASLDNIVVPGAFEKAFEAEPESKTDPDVQPVADNKFTVNGELPFASPEQIAQAHENVALAQVEQTLASITPQDREPVQLLQDNKQEPKNDRSGATTRASSSLLDKVTDSRAINAVADFFSMVKPSQIKEAFGIVWDLFTSSAGVNEKKAPQGSPKDGEKMRAEAVVAQNVATIVSSEQIHEGNAARLQAERAERLSVGGKTNEERNKKLGIGNLDYEDNRDEYHDQLLHQADIDELERALKPQTLDLPAGKGEKAINQNQMEGGIKGQQQTNAVNAGG